MKNDKCDIKYLELIEYVHLKEYVRIYFRSYYPHNFSSFFGEKGDNVDDDKYIHRIWQISSFFLASSLLCVSTTTHNIEICIFFNRFSFFCCVYRENLTYDPYPAPKSNLSISSFSSLDKGISLFHIFLFCVPSVVGSKCVCACIHFKY